MYVGYGGFGLVDRGIWGSPPQTFGISRNQNNRILVHLSTLNVLKKLRSIKTGLVSVDYLTNFIVLIFTFRAGSMFAEGSSFRS